MNADAVPMGIGQAIVLAAASAVLIAAYVRWIRDRLDEESGWWSPDREMFRVVAPIALAVGVVGLAFWSARIAGLFALLAVGLSRFARLTLAHLREVRRRRPVEPEDRQRRIEQRARRRRARISAMARYGPGGSLVVGSETTTGRPEGRPEDVS